MLSESEHKILSFLGRPSGFSSCKHRVGRGIGSGVGKRSGRGQKGQLARSRGLNPSFEGGQTSLSRKLPKRGFNKLKKMSVCQLNVSCFSKFGSNVAVNPLSLVNLGLMKKRDMYLKILGAGDVDKAFVVSAHFFSKSAIEKIERTGGKVVFLKGALGQSK